MRILTLEIGHFLVAVTFLTRLPVAAGLDHYEGRLARAARYFPLTGVLIGATAGLVFYLASLALAPPLAAGLAIAAGILVTGALHEDGLADTCDGMGARDPERMLEIMRDSRIGSYGTVALVLSIGLRWAALAGLSPVNGLIALIVAHTVSRAMLPPVLTSTKYARSQGLAQSVAGGVRGGEALVATLLAFAVAMTAGPIAGVVAMAAGIAAAGGVLAVVMRRLAGYTGDTLGAIQQVAEIAVLIVLGTMLS